MSERILVFKIGSIKQQNLPDSFANTNVLFLLCGHLQDLAMYPVLLLMQ